MIPVPTQTLGIDTIRMIDHETHLTIETGSIPTIEIKATQVVVISDTKTADRKIIQTTDQIIKDLTTITIPIDHEITRKIENQTITIDKEIIRNHLIGIITVTLTLKTSMEVIQQNNKGE